MKPATVKLARILAVAVLAVVLVAIGIAVWFRHEMRKSLPILDGHAPLQGLSAQVTAERDALGCVTLRGADRVDVARALGYVHAQDRFFQMDLARRHAAGEQAELLGKSAIAHDKATRLYRFRSVAHNALAALSPDQRALLEAYAAGVNAGLASLAAKPFEYFVLRSEPSPWLPEDSLLVLYAQAIDLQGESIRYERSLATMSDDFGKTAVGYFAPLIGPEDAALDGTQAPLGPMPSERLIDIRKRVYEIEGEKKRTTMLHDVRPAVSPGSNAIALSGTHTASGAGMVANDLHSTLSVPNLWYRASLHFPANGNEVAVTGVTLPGFPLVLAGSNGHVAWGLANAYADTADLVVINPASGPGTYMDMDKPKMYDTQTEVIQVRGAKSESVEYSWTPWGPVVGTNIDKRDLALKWTLQDPTAINLNLMALETARTVNDAVAVAHQSGMPVQCLVAADTEGAVAWTLCGYLPRRLGYDGRLPATWAYGDRKWLGYVAPDDIPTEITPGSGKIFLANQRLGGGSVLDKAGDGGYALPYRAARIRDDLASLEKAAEKDLLAVQLDAHAPVLERWHGLLLKVLSPDESAKNRDRAQMRVLAEPWEGEARTDSVSYTLVSAFRQNVIRRVLPVVFEPCYDAYPEFEFRRFNYEAALWDMVQKRPPHLIAQEYGSWDDVLLAAADDVIQEMKKEHGALKRSTWGEHNRADIHHRLAAIFPGVLGTWLRMAKDPLAGDTETPRLQTSTFGATARFVVSPGREADGFFEMPCGQSGHPLSPFYRAGHDAWAQGKPSPFLPGAAQHTLTLQSR